MTRDWGGQPGLEGLTDGTLPYPWPYDGALEGARLALVVAGANQSWANRCADLNPVRTAVDQTAAMVRHHGNQVVLLRHTNRAVGSCGPDDVLSSPPGQGHRGDELVVRPGPTDAVVDTAGIDGFFGSSLDALLRSWGCTHLAIAGFGLEAPVHSTLRSANDRGYECLLLVDACAAMGEQTRRGALSTVMMSGGIFGAVGTIAQLAAMLEATQTSDLGPGRI